MADSEAQSWLGREDSVCRSDRVARLEWISSLTSPSEYLRFPGGWIAKYLFEEARYCFVYGQFMATSVLGMAYIERTLAALLYGAGRSDLERASVFTLLREAVDNGWLDESEFQTLDEARRMRNPIAHFRRPGTEDTIEHRSVVQNELPYSILEQDARHVMIAVFRLVARNAI